MNKIYTDGFKSTLEQHYSKSIVGDLLEDTQFPET